jgi:hypothetical protein
MEFGDVVGYRSIAIHKHSQQQSIYRDHIFLVLG